MPSRRWWDENAKERYWLETTDREDLGENLKAPELDERGRPNWHYTLAKEAKVGDVIFHYDKRPETNAIVAFSRVSGPASPATVRWVSRGVAGRNNRSEGRDRPGFIVPLADFKLLPQALTLPRLRDQVGIISAVFDILYSNHPGPLYFPFELSSKRPLRLLQGYAFKLPLLFVSAFPELANPLGLLPVELSPKGIPTNSGDRNPAWSKDELIVALSFYFKFNGSPPDKASNEIEKLVTDISDVARASGVAGNATFRNANGVYMKLMNFRRFDPVFVASGKVGLKAGNKIEEELWNQFTSNREGCFLLAKSIVSNAHSIVTRQVEPNGEEDIEADAEEGRTLTRVHHFRERNRKIVEEKKRQVFKAKGSLQCTVCLIDFGEAYGQRGYGFIECHHTKPVSQLEPGAKTRLSDLELLCANCHRMVHAKRPWLSIDELKRIFRKGKSE
jgi:5-methylcytosine-specific restriction enzyme A